MIMDDDSLRRREDHFQRRSVNERVEINSAVITRFQRSNFSTMYKIGSVGST